MSTRSPAHKAADPGEWRVLAGLVALAVVVLYPYRHFAGDDAYITFHFAQNLATGHGYSFNPDHPTYGSTSPLWAGMIAASYAAGFSLTTGAHLLDAIFVLLAICSFFRLTRMYLRRLTTRIVAVALLILDPWFVHWAMSGMENALAISLFCCVALSRQISRDSVRADILTPFLCGLGILTRPEFGIVAALVVLDSLVFGGASRVKKCAIDVVVVALVVAPWLVYAEIHFGTIVPNTVTAKLSPHRLAALEGAMKYFASFYVFEALGLFVLLAVRGRDVVTALGRRAVEAEWLVVMGWMIGLPLFYIVGGAPVAGRYLVFGLPAYLLVGVKAWEVLLGAPRMARFARPGILALACMASAFDIGVQARYVWYVTAWPDGMDPKMVELGRWLRDHTAPGDVIATDQVGVVGFFSQRVVLDLAGLVSPEMQAPRRGGETAMLQAVRRDAPEWLVLLDDKAHLAALVPDYASIELVATYDVQREGAAAAGTLLHYKLYRTGWSKPVRPT